MKRLLALGLALAAVVAFAAPASAEPVEVDFEEIAETRTAQIYMRVDATAKQVTQVRRAVMRDDDIVRFAHLTKEDSLREYRRIFGDSPAVTAEDLPVSFDLELAKDVDRAAFRRRYKRLGGVDGVDAPRITSTDKAIENLCAEQKRLKTAQRERRVEVFMTVDASAAAIDSVQATISTDPAVDRFEYFDKQDAFEEFERIFKDDPELLRGLDAASLPSSFRLRLVRGADVDTLEQQLEQLPGVDDVAVPRPDPALEAACATRSRSTAIDEAQ